MFVLTEMRDSVRVVPELFDANHPVALQLTLNEKYADKVLPNVGLCICVYDLLSFGDSVIHPGDHNEGASWTPVHFRLVVFRPFVGEILTGRITESNFERGIRVSTGFFTDIWVPPGPSLEPQGEQSPAVFNRQEGLWAVRLPPDPDDPDAEEEHNFYDPQMVVRVRVTGIAFDTEVKAPFAEPPKPAHDTERGTDVPPAVPPADPMLVIGSFSDPPESSQVLQGAGLGPTEWWDGTEAG
eukprot:TRINITY_DN25161_c0_g1_i1.p2 TRINITY_DN25161_c0_g1~~TRINITY_DN25161_c0_g1_i1.p2  ORF type:complete len:268 (+),score=89.32 TRINITY_DN25161_c0_g1_i1:87-806(+)